MSTLPPPSTLAPTSALAGLTPGVWTVDPSHSTVAFSVRHLMVAKVRGRFADFTGTLTVDADPLQSSVEAVVRTASIDSDDDGRDTHLRGADFLDVETFPEMTLRSTSIEARGDDYVMHADLTIKGVTRRVDLALEFAGVATDPWGNVKAGFTATGDINRKDWGLEWNVALETGGVLVGEKVSLVLDIEAVRA